MSRVKQRGEGDRKHKVQFKITPQRRQEGERHMGRWGSDLGAVERARAKPLRWLTWHILGAAKGQCGCGRAGRGRGGVRDKDREVESSLSRGRPRPPRGHCGGFGLVEGRQYRRVVSRPGTPRSAFSLHLCKGPDGGHGQHCGPCSRCHRCSAIPVWHGKAAAAAASEQRS